ncbi:MAG: Glu/Leu/Phe/Val dehydrogenase dimerization domain-containing protein, partial [Gammaproteobacteria bacterium]|nr:Glu/Leu/Phe/Val dehydrogenase dimerization domain-containing protein [Gammaproteobacteria bacterium]
MSGQFEQSLRTALQPASVAPLLWHLTDADGTLLGFAAIDRIVAGRSCGGIRAAPEVTADEIARIARVMTLKCGFVGLASGGAKGGVIVPAHFTAEQRTARLSAYGRAVSALLRCGVWSHGADLGTTDVDIARIRHAAGIGPEPSAEMARAQTAAIDLSSGTAAGLTVALATEAALESLGIELRGARIALQGAGAVGRAAIAALAARGARIVAVATRAGTLHDDHGLNVPGLLEASRRVGDAFTAGSAPPQSVLRARCDALLLCAGSDAIDSASAAAIDARAVICGANIPFTDEVGAQIGARGILVIPDFVAGGGGVLGSTLFSVAGITVKELEGILRRQFKMRVARTIAQARARR